MRPAGYGALSHGGRSSASTRPRLPRGHADEHLQDVLPTPVNVTTNDDGKMTEAERPQGGSGDRY